MDTRRSFLKKSSMLGAFGLLPLEQVLVDKSSAPPPPDCVLIPTETAGPFPLDLTENQYYFRQDIREDRQGVVLTLRLRIIGNNNCEPMSSVRVHIWHCDKDGLYSSYNQQNNQGQAGKTYLRGYQFTDANGEVAFTTIFPGWYTGRICHIHFQVHVSSSYSAISQLSFPIPEKQALYAAHNNLYTKGSDPMTFQSDNIFSDGYAYQLATLTANTTTGGYDSFLEVAVQGSGISSIGYIEKQNAKVFTLGQNYPNPATSSTTIPIEMVVSGQVQLDLYSLAGQKIGNLLNDFLAIGSHTVAVDFAKLGIPTQNCVYQITVNYEGGRYTDCKMLTIVQ